MAAIAADDAIVQLMIDENGHRPLRRDILLAYYGSEGARARPPFIVVRNHIFRIRQNDSPWLSYDNS